MAPKNTRSSKKNAAAVAALAETIDTAPVSTNNTDTDNNLEVPMTEMNTVETIVADAATASTDLLADGALVAETATAPDAPAEAQAEGDTANQASTTPKAKKPRQPRAKGMLNFRDVQVSVLVDGCEPIRESYREGKVSRTTLRRAADDFASKGRTGDNVAALTSWVDEITVSGDRGRKPLLAGDSRAYKAQQLKEGGTFLRVPLSPIGVLKGGDVQITVSADGLSILITKL